MKEHPIIFSGPMVRAILDGRKTQTRRVVKPQPPNKTRHMQLTEGEWCAFGEGTQVAGGAWCGETGDPPFNRWKCPYGQRGDMLWVREIWKPTCSGLTVDTYVRYRADDSRREIVHSLECRGHDTERWRPSIHMPRWASRITLEITAVRVQRAQDISDEDAEAEGVVLAEHWHDTRKAVVDADGRLVHQGRIGPTARFSILWDDIYAKDGLGWDANPWVWIVEFRHTEEA